VKEDPVKQKPKSKKSKNFRPAKRRCKTTRKKIESNSPGCKWFNPSSVYCENKNQQIKIINCLNRRRNEGKIPSWDICKSCRQFELEIMDIAIKYWINASSVKEKKDAIPKKERAIKRRGETPKPKRIIKRRKKVVEPKRTIKRRKKEEPKRIIKRREKCSLEKWSDIILKKPRRIKRRK